jgi:hypothetical protein
MENATTTTHGQHAVIPAANIAAFVLAGAADFTVENTETGGRFTFSVIAPEKKSGHGRDYDAPVRFVKVMTGPNNESDFTFLGTIFTGSKDFRHSAKSRISPESPSALAFAWFWKRIATGAGLPAKVRVWHEGRCARCHHKLTVPESIAAGFGPDCLGLVGLAA